MELSVGKDIFAQCGKCGPLWHVIAAMEGLKVTKTQCKNCMNYHRYKAVPGEVDVNKVAKLRTRKTIGARGSKKSAAGSSATTTTVVEADVSRPVRAYSMRETFEPGDRIDHPKFGRGVVEATPSPDKILVCFPSGRRTLAHARGKPGAADSGPAHLGRG